VAIDRTTLSIDFAALRTLRVVFDQASFSKAAEQLGLNQSTVSYTMDRLREAFQDPLFVRQGSGIAPTDRCIEIVERTGRLLDDYEALVAPPKFDPTTAKDTITLSCNYYEQCVIFPSLVPKLRLISPNLIVEVTPATHQGMEHLRRGRTDLLIGPYEVDNDSFYLCPLLTDHYVCVMDRKNPLASKALTIETYLNASHAVVTYGGTWQSPYLVELDRRSLVLNHKFSVPSLSDLVNVLPGTDLISTIPNHMAMHLGPDLCITPCPILAKFQLGLVWTSRTQHSAAHRWLRQMIIDACKTKPAPARAH